MKKFRLFLLCLMVSLLGVSSFTLAEDIDIYSANADNFGVPNLMFVLDSSSNSDGSFGTCTYWDGTLPSMGAKTLGNEQCALANIVHALPKKSDGAALLNLGITTSDGLFFKLTPIDDNAYTGIYSVPAGTTNRQAFILAVKAMTKHTGSVVQGDQMQETWAYYTGGNGGTTGKGLMSGIDFLGTNMTTGCQKNFAIFLGSADNNSHAGDNGNGSASKTALNAAIDNTTSWTTAEKTALKATITSRIALPDKYISVSNAREWAQFMYRYDANNAGSGIQSIVTYTLSLGGANVDMKNFIKDMSNFGGGKGFNAASYAEMVDAILKVLNEVQAVNSVFSSASLPVSVNAQGSYLNQVFLGMFRPDASANPRWVGNLKQYQFVLTGDNPLTSDIKLGDSKGDLAISSAGTSFIQPGAVSFWTQDSAARPDGLVPGGFFKNDVYRPANRDAYDSPDGELVERGGVAQQLRIANLNADFSATAGGSSNPRRLYTYCPANANCEAALTSASNAFAIANTGIAPQAFGASTTIAVNSIVRTGTTALVTTSGNHGFTAGTTQVTISNATQSQYNVTQTISSPSSATTFTIAGLPDYPTTPSQGAYTFATIGSGVIPVISFSRSTTGSNTSETVTVVTNVAHSFTTGSTVTIGGVTPSDYNGNWTIALPASVACPTSTCFTYSIPIYPAPSATGFTAVVAPVNLGINAINIPRNSSTATLTTKVDHNFHQGQSFKILATGESKFDGLTFTVTLKIDSKNFTFTGYNGNPGSVIVGEVSPSTTGQTISLSRGSTTDSATATATNAPSNSFGRSAGDTKILNITKLGVPQPAEAAYYKSNVTITCLNTGCTSFTYPINISPSASASGSITASLPSGSSTTISAGNIKRSGTTATVTGATANLFGTSVGATRLVNVSVSGSFPNESAYLGSGNWTITCTAANCSTFTFGPLDLTPLTSDTSSNMQAYSASSPPDRDTIIKWVRGHDNAGDELGPGGLVTVRPSIHGDVLHSRPVVVNYGDSRGLVVFYGANDGVFRAVNGSQTAALGSVPAGGELWGLVLQDHFNQLNRLRVNSPELKLPSTTLASAQPKNYFVDGSPGVYQKLKADGTVDKAYLFLTMRRGGRLIYAIDVSIPTEPKVMWKLNGDSGDLCKWVGSAWTCTADSYLSELGQTWSRPRVTLVKGSTNPVLVFGAGYDTAEDAEPPTANTMGRGIFVLDAVTGARVWSAAYTSGATACTGSSTQAACAVSGMNWAIPADISFVDRDNDGKTDRFYAADLGGNVWRVDLEPTAGNTPDKWQVNKLAALGCPSGSCSIGTTPRKFFFPPNVVPVGAAGASGSYDVVLLGSGDREHPLTSAATGSAYNVTNRFYALKDTFTGKDATGITAIIETGGLFNASSLVYDGTLKGFYTTFAIGEKAVNASTTLRGTTFFGTNKPKPPDLDSCVSNLGQAKGYALDPFKGTSSFTVYQGGGLPPSPTTGIVTILLPDGTPVKKEFCIGCAVGGTGSGGNPPPPCNSALEACTPTKKVAPNLRRTYWYKK